MFAGERHLESGGSLHERQFRDSPRGIHPAHSRFSIHFKATGPVENAVRHRCSIPSDERGEGQCIVAGDRGPEDRRPPGHIGRRVARPVFQGSGGRSGPAAQRALPKHAWRSCAAFHRRGSRQGPAVRRFKAASDRDQRVRLISVRRIHASQGRHSDGHERLGPGARFR